MWSVDVVRGGGCVVSLLLKESKITSGTSPSVPGMTEECEMARIFIAATDDNVASMERILERRHELFVVSTTRLGDSEAVTEPGDASESGPDAEQVLKPSVNKLHLVAASLGGTFRTQLNANAKT